MNAVIQKWDQILGNVIGRFDVVLAEATSASQPLVDGIEGDLGPLTVAWGAVETQKHRHGEEISSAWNQISSELSQHGGLPEGTMAQEGNKRDLAVRELEIRYQRSYRWTMGAAADRLLARALVSDAGNFCCTNCGAPLDNIKVVSQALNVECGYCGSLVTVEPGTALRNFAAMGALFLAERDAFPPWEAMVRAELQMKQYRNHGDVPLGLLQHYEAAARAYWSTRLQTETRYVPEQLKYLDSKLDRYVKDVHRTLHQYPQWRRAQAL
jgi:hypothetical protein